MGSGSDEDISRSVWDNSRETFSSIASSFSGLSSSIASCFQCNRAPSCFNKQEAEPEGAWFDVEQFQGEQPFCYVNPVALEGVIPAPAVVQPKALAKSVSPNGRVPELKPLKSKINEKSFKKFNFKINDHTKLHKNKHFKTLSFATKLEEDRQHKERDNLRAEGRTLESPFKIFSPAKQQKKEKLPPKTSHNAVSLRRKSYDFSESSSEFPVEFSNEGFEDIEEKVFQGEIWRASEIEDAFGVYNMATFYSYGAVPQSFKYGTEKFESIFPHNFQNNNTLKSSSHGDQSTSSPVLETFHKSAKTSPEKHSFTESEDSISEDDFKEFIKICIFMNSSKSAIKYFSDCHSNSFNCDTTFFFSGTNFNKNLIFDLVKEVMNDCIDDYSNTLLLSDNYPVVLVQKKVFAVVNFKTKFQTAPSFLSTDIKMVRERFLLQNPVSAEDVTVDDLIATAVSEDTRKEGREWRDFEKEENELKGSVADQIWSDLLCNTSFVVKMAFENKFTKS